MKVVLFLLIYALGELIAHFIFKAIRKRFQRGQSPAETESNQINTIAKGLLERFLIFICLVNELPHALTVLGALKLGTRLDVDKQHAVSNDYFLIGNLTSIMLAIFYFLIWQKWGDAILAAF